MSEREFNSVFEKIRPYPTKSISDEIKKTPDVINLSIGEPCYGTPTSIIDATIEALEKSRETRSYEELLHGEFTHYEHSQGAASLRQAIAKKYEREHRLHFDPNTEILVTNGGIEAVFLSLMSVLNPGDEVIIPDPSYAVYEPMVTLHRGIPVRASLSRESSFQLDPETIRRRITNRTKAIILNSPSNPTGVVYDQEHLAKIMDIASDRGIYVLHDEVHEKILYHENKHHPIARFDNHGLAIMINSCSKAYAMTGWRLGWMIATSELTEVAQRAHTYANLAINTFVQQAGTKALADPAIENKVRKMVKEYKEKRDFFVAELNALPGITCTLPNGTFYAFPNVDEFYANHKETIKVFLKAELAKKQDDLNSLKTNLSSREFDEKRRSIEEDFQKTLDSSSMAVVRFFISKAKVGCVPGIVFGKCGEGHIRFSFAVDMHYLQEAAGRLKRAVENAGE